MPLRNCTIRANISALFLPVLLRLLSLKPEQLFPLTLFDAN